MYSSVHPQNNEMRKYQCTFPVCAQSSGSESCECELCGGPGQSQGVLCAGGATLSPLSPRGALGHHEAGHCVLWGELARAVPPCHEVRQKRSGSPHCHRVFTQSKTSSIDPK